MGNGRMSCYAVIPNSSYNNKYEIIIIQCSLNYYHPNASQISFHQVFFSSRSFSSLSSLTIAFMLDS